MMSQKRIRTTWSRCLKCSMVLSDRDLSKHDRCFHSEAASLSFCSSSNPLPTSATVLGSTDLTTPEKQLRTETAQLYGYIQNQVLHAVATVIAEIPKEIKLPQQVKENVAYLSPGTMRVARIPIGDPVCINDRYVLQAWPLGNVPDCHIHLPKRLRIACKVTSKTVVQVKLLGACQEASSFSVFIDDREYKDINRDHFSRFIKANIVNRVLALKNKLIVHYFGRPINVTVTDISASEELARDITEQLVDSVRSLNVSSADGEPDYQLLTSTPSAKPALSASKHRQLAEEIGSPIKTTEHSAKFYRIVQSTSVELSNEPLICDQQSEEPNRSAAIIPAPAGYDRLLESLDQLIREPITSHQLYAQYGVCVPRGILLFGPSGCGKTMVGRYMEHRLKGVTSFIYVDTTQLWSKQFGESESRLQALFQEAVDKAPSILFIDDIDVMCPRKERSQSDLEKRILSSLIVEMDRVASSPSFVFVLATTNKPDNVDISLRRPGRLDKELEMAVPTSKQRAEIIECMMKPVLHNLSKEEISETAADCHGYVGADLQQLCREASLQALRSTCQSGVSVQDLKHAMSLVQPSAMREVYIDIPKVRWSDIGGQSDLKQKLIQAIEWPLRHMDKFKKLGITPPRGVLMYGPPGCSKTMIAKALATETSLNFISIKGPELFSKWVGESEKAVREIFRKARSAAPSIVFFDEIDAIAVERGSQSSGGGGVGDRVLAQMLTELDGVEGLQDVCIVAATNRPDMIDKALLRPGRLDRIVYVPLPDKATRLEIFKLRLNQAPLASDVCFDRLVEQTSMYSGAEITAVCNEAAINSLQEDMDKELIEWKHFEAALCSVKGQTTTSMVKYYEEYASRTSIK